MRKYEIEHRGHTWKRDEDGEIDIFGYYPADPHNGPICVVCGYGFCRHCQEVPDCDCTVIDAVAKDLPAELPARVNAR